MKTKRDEKEIEAGFQSDLNKTADKLTAPAQAQPVRTYRARFTGRQLGAIGKFQRFETDVEARSKEEANLELYKRFEHISNLELSVLGDTPAQAQHSPRPTHETVKTDKGIRIDPPTNTRLHFAQLERQELSDIRKQRDNAQAHAQRLAEELAVTKSQIENHDATLAQVRLIERHKAQRLADALNALYERYPKSDEHSKRALEALAQWEKAQ